MWTNICKEFLQIYVDNDNDHDNDNNKAKIDNIQHNSKYRLCRDRDEMVYHILSKCSKLSQEEYKYRYY